MKPQSTPRIASKDNYSSLARLNVYVFVDGNDVGISLSESDSLDYVLENPERSIRRLTHHCRNFGHIQEACVFDDDWHPIRKGFWVKEGFEAFDVEKENLDSRVSRVMSLRAFQTATRLSGNAVFLFVVGGSNYQELIEEVQRKGFKVVLLGIDEYQTDRVKKKVDIWVPFQRAVPDLRVKKGTGISGYDWEEPHQTCAPLYWTTRCVEGARHCRGGRVQGHHRDVQGAKSKRALPRTGLSSREPPQDRGEHPSQNEGPR
jgi:hypothetical protein